MTTEQKSEIEPTGYDPTVGMTIGLDRAEGALNYVNLALTEMDDPRGSKDMLRRYLSNARFLLMGKKS